MEGMSEEAAPAPMDKEEGADTPVTTPSQYQYRPLSSPTFIMLIDLLPGKDLEPISCALRPVNLEDKQ